LSRAGAERGDEPAWESYGRGDPRHHFVGEADGEECVLSLAVSCQPSAVREDQAQKNVAWTASPESIARMETILDRIGNTSLLPLRHIAPTKGARILLKSESENPTGSMKDRMALAMIEAAERDGRLPAGGTVVEYTGGSTGVSLALVCAVKRHPL